MSKSDLLKDSMKGGLDGLLSPTKKTTGGKQPVAAPTEKETAVHCNFVINKSIHTRMKFLAIKKNMSLKDIVNEAMRPFLSARCFHRTHSSCIVLPSFSFLPARKYRHMARFIPILTLTGISLFYRFPYRFPDFILCRHRCVLSDAKVRCRA